MTTPEVARAAERLREHRQVMARGERLASPYCQPRPGLPSLTCTFDEMALSNAYLAEHLADDSDPVDEFWLKQIGFHEHDCDNQPCRKAFSTEAYDLTFSPHYFQDFLGRWAFHGVTIPSPQTRGDLRRLATVLGIQLTEPV